MTSPEFGDWICDPSAAAFTLPLAESATSFWAIRCPCGSTHFRASGSPTSGAGPGSYFWRALNRFWREIQQMSGQGEPTESPFALPLILQCVVCDLEGEILSNVQLRIPPVSSAPPQPREAYRCRVCRRSAVELVVGISKTYLPGETPNDQAREPAHVSAAEVVARCVACRRASRIAWFDNRPTSQELRLDLLYGRR